VQTYLFTFTCYFGTHIHTHIHTHTHTHTHIHTHTRTHTHTHAHTHINYITSSLATLPSGRHAACQTPEVFSVYLIVSFVSCMPHFIFLYHVCHNSFSLCHVCHILFFCIMYATIHFLCIMCATFYFLSCMLSCVFSVTCVPHLIYLYHVCHILFFVPCVPHLIFCTMCATFYFFVSCVPHLIFCTMCATFDFLYHVCHILFLCIMCATFSVFIFCDLCATCFSQPFLYCIKLEPSLSLKSLAAHNACTIHMLSLYHFELIHALSANYRANYTAHKQTECYPNVIQTIFPVTSVLLLKVVNMT